MVYVVISFRSRTDTLAFSNLLKSYNVKNYVINTPRQLSVSCGVSVKIDIKDTEIARTLLARRNFVSFAGIFLINQTNNDFFVKQIWKSQLF